ncbi:hypothetical protein ZWY2020_059665 [Hordeum vulgare]|nr:hypothetical protein ZWY2020_059665 [Hordeum vulgare]
MLLAALCAAALAPAVSGQPMEALEACIGRCGCVPCPTGKVRAAQPPPGTLPSRPPRRIPAAAARRRPPYRHGRPIRTPPTIPGPSDGQSPLPAGPAATTSAAMPPPSRPGFVPPRPIGAADPSQILVAKPPAPSKRGGKAGTGAGRQTTKRPATAR